MPLSWKEIGLSGIWDGISDSSLPLIQLNKILLFYNYEFSALLNTDLSYVFHFVDCTCILQGIIASGLIFTVLAWCVKKRGPIFVSAFSPFMLLVVVIAGFLVLDENLHLGRYTRLIILYEPKSFSIK